jgi:hypothetical protein
MRRFSFSSKSLLAAIALCGCASGAAPEQVSNQEAPMRATFYQASLQDVRLPSRPPLTIRDAEAPVPPPFAPDGRRGCERPHCGPEQNSRIGFAFARKTPAVVWKAPMPSGFRAAFVLATADRIVLDGEHAWLLLDHAGKTLQQESRADGDICADPNTSLFYAPTQSGYLAAYDLSDGKRRFLLSLYFGNDFQRSFILPMGRRLLAASVERPSDPHGARQPNMAVVEVHELSTPLELSEIGRLKSERLVNDIKRRTATLLVAAHDDTIALATADSVYLADADLKLRTELRSEFEPLQISFDEHARIYAVVRRTGEEIEFWVLTESGQRVARVALPSGFTPTAPPIVRFDHSVYLIDSRRVLAIDGSKRVLWDRTLGSLAGAVTDADNSLLVSAGDTIVSITSNGEQRIVFRAEGDTLTSPPSVTPSGDLLVAGERYLYFLR